MARVRSVTGVFAVCGLVVAVIASPARGADIELRAGVGYTEVAIAGADGERLLPVHYFLPKRADAETPVVVIMHGAGRNADGYRDAWIAPAETHGWLIAAPEFSKRDYPSAYDYNLGNVATKDGRRIPPAQWGFTAVERLAAEMAKRAGSRCRRFGIYGHSAGAQFVHRMLLFRPDAPIAVAVAANAGWYTLPDPSMDWPFGLGGAQDMAGGFAGAFARKLVVLLGGEDTDPNGRYLNRSPGAMAQGAHRFERGTTFFARAQAMAAKLSRPFNWEKAEVAGVGHSNRRMAPAAARHLARHLRCD